MQTTERPQGDLRTLSRDGATTALPRPRFPWKTRLLVPGAILIVLLLLIGYTAQDVIWPARAVRVVPVVLKAGGAGGSATTTIQAPGWVEADPYPIAVPALADGIVKEVLALEGHSVKAGDVVVRMVDDDAKLSLARAEAELAEKHAQLEAAQRSWDNPVERTRAVASAEAMVAERKADLEKLNAEIATEVARLASAKLEAERTAEAFKTRASSEVEAVRTEQIYQAQKAIVEATRARRPVFEAQLAQRTAEMIAAKENLRLRIDEAEALARAKANAALAQAARDEAALRLARMEVRSPADGIVMQRLAEPGTKLVMNMDDAHSAHAVRLYDPKRLQVRVDVPLADAAKVGVGQLAKVVVGVLPDHTFDGKVTRIVNEADIQKNTLQVKVAITDPSPQLKPEMLARVRFAGAVATTGPATAGQVVFAPLELLHRMGDSAHVWTVEPRRGVAVRKLIQLGSAQQDGWVEVVSGLSAGDQLIADHEGLSDGQRVRVAGEASVTTAAKGGAHAAH